MHRLEREGVGAVRQVRPRRTADPLDVVARVLEHPRCLGVHVQPIADLARGAVAGYEVLSRFGPDAPPPDAVFAAAEAGGLGGALDAVVLERAVQLLDVLPGSTFLTVNTGPERWVEDGWRQLVEDLAARRGGLQRLVVELTEHVPYTDLPRVREGVARVRELGAMVALDDAGTGYSGLLQLAQLRPDIVKVDRALVSSLDTDPVKAALVELLGSYAGRLDAWLLAEGVETEGELTALVGLGIPLAQGYLLGRPAPVMAALDPAVRARVRELADRVVLQDALAPLVRPVAQAPLASPPAADAAAEATVLVHTDGSPAQVLLQHPGGARRVFVTLRCHPSEPVTEVARRAMSRRPEQRFDPVVVVDPRGLCTGVVLMEDVVLHLARTGQA
ncbi:EAL domain-containing protein [Quadrisphaera sp. DSM 44207]|uniref:EAL domain-containing protein n=1 Tax=Quadrisphaera sp. DSM 44207 TaxID=1881057 RepID=UPI0008922FA9|nr:EAL domain-containing protein [Quadrisphaera sp. DSM 44207]SDQ46931.1 EAL domain, c-di-GMP-specific phosphodiesterase class I (or its enzymatically inactive variant) [Quadrisphaera sp. DSM 44207]